MWLVEFATRRPVTIAMATTAILLFGLVSLSRLQVNLLPELSFPTLTVRTDYPGAAPGEVETLVTKPIEEALGIVRNLRRVRSLSRAGRSDVTLEFQWGTSMDSAVLDVREKLDAIDLPDDARRPLVLRYDPGAEPVMRLGLTAGEADGEPDEETLRVLRRVAEEQLRKGLEAEPGVAAVKINGGLEEEIQVLVDQQRLARLGLAVGDVAERIRQENVNLSGGRVEEGTFRYLVRTLNQFGSVKEIGDTLLAVGGEHTVRLRDVAEIRVGHRERESIIRIDGREAVELGIYKEGDANTVAVAKAVEKALERLKKRIPETFEVTLLYDQSRFIRQAIENVTRSAVLGGLLAVLVLYLFLRRARTTLIIGLAIPLSVVATFNLMYGAGLSLNVMSLGGIALAVGLLVDNAIVVLENIARRQEQGLELTEAVRRGAGEMASAVTASTLTTVAVFLPMVFVQGVAGQLFSDQALVVTFALLFSLLVALTVIPVFVARGRLSVRQAAGGPAAGPPRSRFWRWIATLLTFLVLTLLRLVVWPVKGGGWLLGKALAPAVWLVQRLYTLLERLYGALLGWGLRHRAGVLLLALAVLSGTLSLLPRLGVELIPTLSQGEFVAEVSLPPGSRLEETDRVLREAAAVLEGWPGVDHVHGVAGSAGGMADEGERGGRHHGSLFVSLEKGAGARLEEAAMERLRQRLAHMAGVEYRIGRPTLFTLEIPLEVEIAGYDLARLREVNHRLVERLEADPRFTDVESTLGQGVPELRIRFQRDRVAALGLEARQLADRVVDEIKGDRASRYRLPDRDIDILVRAREEDRADVTRIGRLIVNPESEHPLPLSAVAEMESRMGAAEIRRLDQRRVVLVRASPVGIDLGSAAAAVEAWLARQPLPPGVGVTVGGQKQEMDEAFASMQFALWLAVFMVYLVMASQFESFTQPLVILFTIPLAAIGAVLGLWLTGQVVNVVVFIGLIVLAGIVVNNGIVLIDLINRLREEGMERMEAIRRGTAARLRPIVMTTLTTALGLLPMAVAGGEGSELRVPLAVTVIGGLLASTLLTLLVIPVTYSLLDRRRLPQDRPGGAP